MGTGAGAGAPAPGGAAARGAPQERQNLLVGWLLAPHRVQTIMSLTPETCAAPRNQEQARRAAYPVSPEKARNRSGLWPAFYRPTAWPWGLAVLLVGDAGG